MTQALLKSADKAVTDAGVDVQPVPKKKAPKTQNLRTDVLIIGGGEAGLVAGCRALTMGQKVILVEKNGYLGGATILNGSNVVGTGSDVAAQIFDNNHDTPEMLAQDVARESLETNYPALTDLSNAWVITVAPLIVSTLNDCSVMIFCFNLSMTWLKIPDVSECFNIFKSSILLSCTSTS